MRSWLLKTKNWEFLESGLVKGANDTWPTKKPPRIWEKGDRLFIWAQAPKLRLEALAVLADPAFRRLANSTLRFKVQYLTDSLQNPVPADSLRNFETFEGASFLRSGPMGTVFPLTEDQALRLYKLVVRFNPKINVWQDWQKQSTSDRPAKCVLERRTYQEGGSKLHLHRVYERDPRAVADKKRLALQRDGKLACEVCDFDFVERYGELGRGFCEVHHVKPIGGRKKRSTTSASELAIVCANCHRMIHAETSVTLSIAQLRHTTQGRRSR